MKFVFQVMATYEGKTKNLVDVEVFDGKKEKIFTGVPFFDKDGREITYDEALELYGEDGLSQDIWDNPEYLKRVKSYAEKHSN